MNKYFTPLGRIKNLLFLLAILVNARTAFSQQPGEVDLSFNPTDVGFGSGTNREVYTTAVQADGKVLIGGLFTTFIGQPANYLARLSPTGQLEPSFISGTGPDSSVFVVKILSDGKILVGGDFDSYNGIQTGHLVRLHPDGSIDTSFHGAIDVANPFSRVRDILLQADGKILIAGWISDANGNPIYQLARLNADGTFDPTYNPVVSGNLYDMALQPDGKLICVGTYGGSSNPLGFAERLNTDGSHDYTFLVYGALNRKVNAVAVQPDGRVILGGEFDYFNSFEKLMRVMPNGDLDYSFAPFPNGSDGVIHNLAVQADGKIIGIGNAYSYFGGFFKLNPDGTLDATFDSSMGANYQAYDFAQQPDGKYMVVGSFLTYNFEGRYHLVRLTAGGAIDATFAPTTGPNNIVYAIKQLSTGKILIGGTFTTYNGLPLHRFGRLNPDGTPDLTFVSGLVGINDAPFAIVEQPDGKIIIAGWISSYNGVPRNHIARLLPDGTLDTTFDPGTGPDLAINDIALQPDGKIVVVGNFTTVGNSPRNGIARLNSDGSLDVGFTVGSGFTHPNPSGGVSPSEGSTVSLQPDGKILVGGWFTAYNGMTRRGIVRLNSNGTLDTSFTPGSGATNPSFSQAQVMETYVLPDGKILIGGNFTHYNNIAVDPMVRLNPNGTRDATFTVDMDGQVSRIVVQPDGKILIAGFLYMVNGVERRGVSRMNSNGTLDPTFTSAPDPGYLSWIQALTLQTDGKILVGGDFTSYSGIGRNRIVRLQGGEGTNISTGSVSTLAICNGGTVSVPFTANGIFSAGNIFTAQLSDSIGNFASPLTIGALSAITSGTINAAIPVGTSTGTGFRVRVVASAPITIGSTNGSNIAISSGIATPISAVAAPDSVAPGMLVTLLVSNPDTLVTYTWAGPGLNQTTGDTVTANPSATGTLTYQVYESGNACTDTATVTVVVDGTLIGQINNWNWAINGGGSGGRLAPGNEYGRQLITGEAGVDIAATTTGNTTTLARFKGTASFGATTLVSQGTEDMAIVHASPNGQIEWVRKAGSTAGEEPRAVAIDAVGNSYITGTFSGTATFGTTTLTTSGTDVFLVKYSPAGSVIWAHKAGGAGNITATDIAIDAQFNAILVGYSTGTVSFGSTTLTSTGPAAFIAKYTVGGALQSAIQVGSANAVYAASIALDAQANVYLTGTYQGSATFGNSVLPAPSGTFSRFFTKLSPTNSVLWAMATGTGSVPQDADFVSVDGGGNGYLAGNFYGSVTLGAATLTSAGSSDVYLSRFATNGSLIWARGAGGSGQDASTALAIDEQGLCYVTGSYSGHANFGGKNLSEIGAADVFVAKYDMGGNCLWARKAGGLGSDAAAAVAVDAQGNSYFTGSFESTASFGPGNILHANGQQDMFIARLGHIQTLGNEEAIVSETGIAVYPNPFQNGFAVEIEKAEEGNAEVKLFDALGRQVYTNRLDTQAGKQVLEIKPRHNLSAGVYLLQVIQSENIRIVRVVKH